jgi:NADH/NAD ratio-sensing transcriptional regulator Rex
MVFFAGQVSSKNYEIINIAIIGNENVGGALATYAVWQAPDPYKTVYQCLTDKTEVRR